MWEAILNFMSDMILFTAGLFVAVLWLAVFMAIAIEVHDMIFGEPKKEESDV